MKNKPTKTTQNPHQSKPGAEYQLEIKSVVELDLKPWKLLCKHKCKS